MPTDLYGQSCDLDTIVEIAGRYGVPVICDSAEAMGTIYRGRKAGSGALMAAYSFNGNKVITTSGGGALASANEKLIKRARHLATQAREPVVHYEHVEAGYNYRLSNILAAIGRAQLKVLAEGSLGGDKSFKGTLTDWATFLVLALCPKLHTVVIAAGSA